MLIKKLETELASKDRELQDTHDAMARVKKTRAMYLSSASTNLLKELSEIKALIHVQGESHEPSLTLEDYKVFIASERKQL